MYQFIIYASQFVESIHPFIAKQLLSSSKGWKSHFLRSNPLSFIRIQHNTNYLLFEYIFTRPQNCIGTGTSVSFHAPVIGVYYCICVSWIYLYACRVIWYGRSLQIFYKWWKHFEPYTLRWTFYIALEYNMYVYILNSSYCRCQLSINSHESISEYMKFGLDWKRYKVK